MRYLTRFIRSHINETKEGSILLAGRRIICETVVDRIKNGLADCRESHIWLFDGLQKKF